MDVKRRLRAVLGFGACVAGLAAAWVFVASSTGLNPFPRDPRDVKSRFRARLTALSPNWQEPSWASCEPYHYVYDVTAHYRVPGGKDYACRVVRTAPGWYRVRFCRPGDGIFDFARAEFDHGTFRQAGGHAVRDSGLAEGGKGEPVTDEAERQLLESLAADLVASLRDTD
jgi:hypothetical protein